MSSLSNLEMLIQGAQARAHAQAFVNSLAPGGGSPAVAEASEGIDAMALEGAGSSVVAKPGDTPLFDSLETFERPKPENLIAFPPDFVTVPCKPILFDIARSSVTPPDLSGRYKAQSKRGGGWGSYLFGGRS